MASAGALTTVVAINDKAKNYEYPDIVGCEVDQHNRQHYLRAAAYLNNLAPDVVCVQHEYGIYGGEAGVYLLDLLRNLQPPIVTTLHTILEQPNEQQKAVLGELIQLSETIVVMSQKGKSIIESLYDVSPTKVVVVPHGIPSVQREKVSEPLPGLNLEGRRVILTFGLIAPDKGIENMVRALPAIVDQHPDVMYLVAGATHPHIRAHSGETYRTHLEQLADELGVSPNIRLINQFLKLDELTKLLQTADIYVTPYLKKEQITSGTLAYAYGSGTAVVSTPYWHAEELLADGRGVLVPFRDPEALSREVNTLLEDEKRLKEIQANGFAEGQKIQWPAIGVRYLEVFEEAKAASIRILPSITARTPSWRSEVGVLPNMNFRHLLQMTDDTGIYQHATYSVPNRREGYCTDDNARALRLLVNLSSSCNLEFAESLQTIYLSFLDYALDRKTGRFRNFMSYDRRWLEDAGSHDSHGRALWGLGTVAGSGGLSGPRNLAKCLFEIGLPPTIEFSSLRSWCFTILGLAEFSRGKVPAGEERTVLSFLSKRLHNAFTTVAEPSWQWCEPYLTYDNARIPQAMLAAGKLLEDEQMVSDALRSLDWLLHIQTGADGQFLPIGSDFPYVRGGERPEFDQQPLEATATVDACLDAYNASGHSRYLHEAWRAFAWFTGANISGEPIYNSSTGGCGDGLTRSGVNENQGAESTLAFLSALCSVEYLRENDLLNVERAYLQ